MNCSEASHHEGFVVVVWYGRLFAWVVGRCRLVVGRLSAFELLHFQFSGVDEACKAISESFEWEFAGRARPGHAERRFQGRRLPASRNGSRGSPTFGAGLSDLRLEVQGQKRVITAIELDAVAFVVALVLTRLFGGAHLCSRG